MCISDTQDRYILESPEMFSPLPLDPNNDWVKLSCLVPWGGATANMLRTSGAREDSGRLILVLPFGALLIKPAYKGMSDENLAKEIVMTPPLYWELSNRLESTFCVRALERALKHGKPEIFSIRVRGASLQAMSLRVYWRGTRYGSAWTVEVGCWTIF